MEVPWNSMTVGAAMSQILDRAFSSDYQIPQIDLKMIFVVVFALHTQTHIDIYIYTYIHFIYVSICIRISTSIALGRPRYPAITPRPEDLKPWGLVLEWLLQGSPK